MFDVFPVSKCVLDLPFSDTQFQIAKKDQNKNGGGLLFYVNQDLNSKIVNTYNFLNDIEILPLELALTKRKWLILVLHKTPSLRSEIFISEVNKAMTFNSEKYYYVLLMGDFNITPENHHLKDFTESNDIEKKDKSQLVLKALYQTPLTSF